MSAPTQRDHISEAARISGLKAAGFTDRQAAAVGDAIDATVSEAVEVIRAEVVRGHVYLSLYVLVQIGIALLVTLLAQDVWKPLRRSVPFTRSSLDYVASIGSDDIHRVSLSARPDVAEIGGAPPSFEPAQSSQPVVCESEGKASLRIWRGRIYQDSTERGATKICDSTLMSRALTSEKASTSERHHAPKLDCDRRRSESECAYPPSRIATIIRHQRVIARFGESLPHFT